MRVDLSDTDWVEFRDPSSITNRDRHRFKTETIPAVADRVARERGMAIGDIGEALVGTKVVEDVMAQMITSWSLPLPIPSEQPDVFDDDAFPFGHYDALVLACAPHVHALKGQTFAVTRNEDGSPDRSGPTSTSSD